MKLEDLGHLMPPIQQEEKSKLIVEHFKESAQILPVINATLYKYHHGEIECPLLWRQHSHERNKPRQSLAYVYGIVQKRQGDGEKTNFLAFAFGRDPDSDNADTTFLLDIKELADYKTEKKY